MKPVVIILRTFATIAISWLFVYIGASMVLGSFDIATWDARSDLGFLLFLVTVVSIVANGVLEETKK